MINFDKAEVKSALSTDDIFQLVTEWGGEPEYTHFGFVSATICHNPPGEGSHKLYYYENSQLFTCWTSCGSSFDIFELFMKVAHIQFHKEYDLNSAVRYIAFKFGISGEEIEDEVSELEDWKIFDRYSRIMEIKPKDYSVELKTYDDIILSRLNYNVKIEPWLNEGMNQEALDKAHIGFYPGGDQITIPHYDKDGRFIGLRGRTLCAEEAERFGKYRPLTINKQLYSHPLGMNLYNLNNSRENIARMGKAIVFESEKSCLQYASYFGTYNDISVACCGSNISAYQIHLLLEAGAKEIVIAFDRQFQAIGDDEFKRLVAKLKKIHSKWKNYVNISFIFDKKMITGYKDSPTDRGAEKFLQLFKERIIL